MKHLPLHYTSSRKTRSTASFGRRRRKGSTLLEFALVLPVLLMLIMGIMEFGWLVYNNMMIVNGCREGARSASLGNPTATVTSVVATRVAPLSVTTTVEHSNDGGVTFTTTGNDSSNTNNNAPAGSYVRVTVVYRFRPLTGIFPFLKNRDLTAVAGFNRE